MYWREFFGLANIAEGSTIELCGKEYQLVRGILRQSGLYSDSQSQTKDCFAFKWGLRDTYESPAVQETSRKWMHEKYLGNDEYRLEEWLKPGAKVLDAGCGAGYSAAILFRDYLRQIHYLGADISAAVDVAAERMAEKDLPAEFIQSDLLDLPFEKPVFDLIFSEGVLHHTDSTEKSIKYLSRLLLPGGRFLFYVYRKKAPIREFADDYIREKMKDLTDEEVWEALMPLTRLGQALGEVNVTINVPEDIPYLEIPAGDHNLQRLFYWYIFKAYYRPEWSLDEMNHVNFDWYRPLNCHRHTPEEIQIWCAEAGLEIERFYPEESGITVVACKR